MKVLFFALLVSSLCLPDFAAAANPPPPPAKAKRKPLPNRVITVKRPMKPMTGFVPRVEATLQSSCADMQEVQSVAMRLGVPAEGVDQLFPAQPAPAAAAATAPESTCIHYALATLPAGQPSTLAVLDSQNGRDGQSATILQRRPNGTLDSARETLQTADWQELSFSAANYETEGMRNLPGHLQWESAVLVRQLMAGVESQQRHQLRIVLHRPAGEPYEKIVAVELIDNSSGRVLDSVVWLDRQDDVGAYFNSRGANFERVFWESPVEYTRITRGIGKGAVTIRKRVAVKAPGKQKPTFVSRTFRYRGQHIGVDFVVPVGEPVRAVADAVVVHAGPRGGYGNLIVLEHGKNYQTYYAHLSRFAEGLSVGNKVLRGEEIGYVGMTGVTTGPHLHFEIRRESRHFDPLSRENSMTLWNLEPAEHAQLLAKMIALDVTRAGRNLPRLALPGR